MATGIETIDRILRDADAKVAEPEVEPGPVETLLGQRQGYSTACPACGAIIGGTRPNRLLHVRWHRERD